MPHQIPIQPLLELTGILECTPWECPSFGIREVHRELDEGNFQPEPLPDEWLIYSRAHASRIAYLVKHGWDDPIEIDVGIPGMTNNELFHIVIDGNHRLFAAAVRGDTHILANIQGSLEEAERLFGIKTEA